MAERISVVGMGSFGVAGCGPRRVRWGVGAGAADSATAADLTGPGCCRGAARTGAVVAGFGEGVAARLGAPFFSAANTVSHSKNLSNSALYAAGAFFMPKP